MASFEIHSSYDKPYGDRIESRISSIFKLSSEASERDYSLEAIHRCFAEIGYEAPEPVIRAHKLLSAIVPTFDSKAASPLGPVKRASLMLEMLAVSEQLALMHAEWDTLYDQLKLMYMPPKVDNGEKLAETERELRMEARTAPFRAVRDIIHYLFVLCSKNAPNIHQSVLNFERDMFKSTPN